MDVATGELLNHYMNNGDDDKSLSGNTVSDICVDESGVVWIGTSTNGISYLDPEMPDVYRIRHERNNDNSLKSDHVNVMFQVLGGRIIGMVQTTASVYQPRSRKWTHYLDGTEYSGKVVLALAEDSGGKHLGRWLWYRCLLYS